MLTTRREVVVGSLLQITGRGSVADLRHIGNVDRCGSGSFGSALLCD
jgi:hypothetical protein